MEFFGDPDDPNDRENLLEEIPLDLEAEPTGQHGAGFGDHRVVRDEVPGADGGSLTLTVLESQVVDIATLGFPKLHYFRVVRGDAVQAALDFWP